jgi:hypothetical protein
MKLKKFAFSVIFIMIFVVVSGLSFADEERHKKTRKYKVTITNLTRGQIFSPPIVIGHNRNFSLFKLGYGASEELAALAEDGMTGPLEILIDDLYPWAKYAVAGGAIMYGESASVYLELSRRDNLSLITVAGMLVSTNDAFFAARDISFYGKGKVTVYAVAYDAGSERNSEECAFIPGPPCGNGEVRDQDGAEGYVHVHAGIHGIAPADQEPRLDPAKHDWRNPVAKITIQRAYR